MRPIAEAGTRGGAFWLATLAMTLNGVVNSANSPLVTRMSQDELGGGAGLAGTLVALTGVSSILGMTVGGAIVDRYGIRKVMIASTAIIVVGLGIVLVALNIPSLAISRILYGIGNAAIAAALTAWIVEAPAHERGRAISLFGVSVWVGMAIGPVLSDNLNTLAGYRTPWTVGIVISLLTLASVVFVETPKGHGRPAAGSTAAGGGTRDVLRAIWLAGTVGLFAWAGEGFLAAFLIQHLESAGVAHQGLFAASNVFAVFAASVIIARLALGSLPDRLGPVVTSFWSLVALTIGLLVLAIATDFWVASIGAVLLGFGFAPIYPALTLLAAERLSEQRRGVGIGIFASMTNLGWTLGALGGGYLIVGIGDLGAFLVCALLPIASAPLLLLHRRGAPPAA